VVRWVQENPLNLMKLHGKEMFEAVTMHFIEPQPEEEFNIIRVQRNA
jgi:hypothetical protein